jgi:ribosomal protein L37AE/L43A
MAEVLTESKVYEYTCTNCGKQIDARKTSAPTRTICRKCVLNLSLNIQNKGTPENPELGDVRKGRELGYDVPRSHRNYIWHPCPVCKIPRWVSVVRGKPESNRCNQCKWDGRKGNKHPNWINTDRRHNFRGYVMVRLSPDDFFYPTCSRRGWIFEHRLVVAKSLGRNLHLWEIVHHKNHIRDDNKLENLQLISDDKHKQFTALELKIDRLLTKQDELMAEIKLLRFENKQLRAGVSR